MKNEKNQTTGRPPRSKKQRGGPKQHHLNHLEGGDGANKNDDRSEDSKGGGNWGLGDQEGANQGLHQGGHGKR